MCRDRIALNVIEEPPAPRGFYRQLGIFHAMWQALDVTIDYTVALAEQLSPQETAERMKGMTHLQKLRLLRTVVKRSRAHGQAANDENYLVVICL